MLAALMRVGLLTLLFIGCAFESWAQPPNSSTGERLDGTVRGIISGLHRATVMVYSPRQVAVYFYIAPDKLPPWVRPGMEVTVHYRVAEDGSFWAEQIVPYKPPEPPTPAITPVQPYFPVGQPITPTGQLTTTAPQPNPSSAPSQAPRQGSLEELRQRQLGSRGLSSALQSRIGQLNPVEMEVQRLLPHYKAAAKFFNPNLTDQQAETIAAAILRSSIQYGVDPRLVVAVIACESSFRPDAVGKKGEIGLGQLKPETAAALGVDPYDPVQNIEGCVRYLRQQWDRFGNWELALAAYNAGPTAVSKAGGIPQNNITPRYVQKVLDLYQRLRGQ